MARSLTLVCLLVTSTLAGACSSKTSAPPPPPAPVVVTAPAALPAPDLTPKTPEERAQWESVQAKARGEAAGAKAEQAMVDEAQAAVKKAMTDQLELGKRIDATTSEVTTAPNESDRKAAMAKLDALRKELVELDARVSAARAAREGEMTHSRARISQECLDNPLAPGC